MKRWLEVLRAAVVAASLALGGAAAAAAVAGHAGRWSALLDVANHFAPIWLALGALAAGASAVLARPPLRRLGVVLGLVAVVASGTMIAPELIVAGRQAPEQAAQGPRLKLVQFNVWGYNSAPKATLAWILAQDADVVAVEEIFGRGQDIGRGLALAYPYRSRCAAPDPCQVRIYSRWPIIDGGWNSGPPTTWVDLDWRGRRASVVATHDYWPYPPGAQQWQLTRLARFINGRPQPWTILAGDFNAGPWSFSLRRFDRAVDLGRRTHGQPTWPAASVSPIHIPTLFPVLAIDQVYAGDAWRTVSVRRGPRLGSDHYPLVVELAPRQVEAAPAPPRPR